MAWTGWGSANCSVAAASVAWRLSQGEQTGLALQKGRRQKKKAWRKGKVQSLGFLAAIAAWCPHTSRPPCLPVPGSEHGTALAALTCPLPPQREKVPVEESPDLSTAWKITFNSRGGRSTKPVNRTSTPEGRRRRCSRSAGWVQLHGGRHLPWPWGAANRWQPPWQSLV